ncbi:MAG: immune inhibitor A domain-containing protein, partial [Syntrophothermus sp.]
MRKRLIGFLAAGALVAGMAFSPAAVQASGFHAQYMPPSMEKIEKALKARGVIAPDAGEDEAGAMVLDYVRLKFKALSPERPENIVLAKKAGAVVEKAVGNVENGKIIRPGKGLGRTPLTVDPFVARAWTGPVKKDKILVLLVEFSDPINGPAAAPEHNYMAKPPAYNNTDFWTSDFSRDYFQKMLFTPGGIRTPEGVQLDSMTDYFLEQSGGS